MKKLPSLLLLVMSASLLSGCGSTAPKFADYGIKIDLDVFVESLHNTYENRTFAGSDLIASHTFYKSTASRLTTELKRNDKTVNKGSQVDSSKEDRAFDAANYLISIKSQTSSSTEERSSYGKGSNSYSEKRETMLEPTIVDDKGYVVSVDKIRKEYSPYIGIDEDYPTPTAFDDIAKAVFNNQYTTFLSVLPDTLVDESALDNYSFYENSGIFTIVIAYNESKDVKNESDEVLYTTTHKSQEIYQIDLSSDNLSYKISIRSDETTTYAMSYGTHIIHDCHTSNYEFDSEAYFTIKDVALKAIDLSGYIKSSF